jgi:hypothetical protein
MPGSPEWTAEQENGTGTRRELAAQVIRLRIEPETGTDSLWTVIEGRRWA